MLLELCVLTYGLEALRFPLTLQESFQSQRDELYMEFALRVNRVGINILSHWNKMIRVVLRKVFSYLTGQLTLQNNSVARSSNSHRRLS